MPKLSSFADLSASVVPHTVLATTAELSTESSAVPEDISGNVPDTVQDGARGAVDSLGPFWGIVSTVAISVVIALLVVTAAWLLSSVVLRRRPGLRDQVGRCRVPLGLAAALLATRIALGLTASDYPWFNGVSFLLLAGVIGALAWLALRVVRIVEERLLDRYASDELEDRRDRKIRTQTVLLRRVLNAVIIVIAVSVVLLTIPSVRAVGAGLLASAGVLSVVAGLAVQSTLTNMFAGIQLAFTDAIRVGDVVIVDGVYGTIEDITLSYVVVKIWDGRRVIFPSSHFTTTPFENWTRTGSALSGTVELDVDWRVPVDATRERLKALLESTELWDGKDSSIQVSEALGGTVKLWVAVSARNAGDLWDLRCLVREDLVTFLRSEYPEALYAHRLTGGLSVVSPVLAPSESGHDGGWETLDGSSGSEEGTDSTGAPVDTGPQHQQRTPTRSLPQVGPDTGQHPSHEQNGGQRTNTGEHPVTGERSPTGSVPLTKASDDSSVFTGSVTAVERNREFAGPGEKAYQERKEKGTHNGEGDEEDRDDSNGDEQDETREHVIRRRPDQGTAGD
ncbi:mechanosensitive ion channel family protein [Citricoccus sp. GCM10030269]|uniref:mechanosensitive ion channel family protein n=1 Tax=Citricoccus sp. GCM10030269 TaxID=3273388 RepID=UPI003615976C